MDLNEIRALIEAMGASDLSEMEIGRDGWTLRLVRHAPGRAVEASGAPASIPPPVVQASAARAPAGAVSDVLAPLSGVAYLSTAPGEPPFVAVGAQVKAGDTVCVVEAMKIFNEVRAERAGSVQEIAFASGDEVDAGQILVRIG